MINGISNFFKDGISIIKNIYNSSVSWTNSYVFYGSLTSGNFNLGMYPGLAMADMYKMEVEKLKEVMGDYEKEQIKKDMAVQEAVTLVAESAKVVEKKEEKAE